uniref:NADH-ubiquinone oxidoreductase chain 4 n=1 Tax=Agathymus micheneri TaxID=2018453 RepID=A0A343W1A1_9NEOP|nr:NADH dehydrogenase subunit 4 [Agathymus micheneri]AVT43716.1 NADH dehydrogenase subunit 4 [Agathymus micheneri]
MLKFMMMILFLIFLCFKKNMFWMVQMCMFMLFFFFLNLTMNILNYCNLSYMMGCDMVSYGLILLSIWICSLMMMASEKLYKYNFYLNFFMVNIILLLLMLYMTFSSMNLFMFYMFFEGSLIPTLLLILGWGYQPERLQAGMYLLFYTLFVSLPLLMGVFFIFSEMNSMMIYFLKFYDLNLYILYFSMVLAFLVKMPMYFFHLWLPKAHVEAPISGSMILAGIMLKLGGYGLIRVLVFLEMISLKLNILWVIISLVGGFFISLKCLMQVDMKSLIAYSSVAHMGMVIGGIMTMNYWGFMGSYILMIGHGLCSSGLFCLANIMYERLQSRSLMLSKGMLNFMPSMSLWWFLLLSAAMAAPPSLNLLGEISLINSMVSWSWMTMVMLMLITFFSAVYSLYLYSYTQHGNYNMSLYSFSMGESREFLMMFLHWLPLNMMILKVDYFMIWF